MWTLGWAAQAGSSAGANLTALCALTQHEQAEPARRRVDAAVCPYGYYGRYYGRGSGESPVSSPFLLDPAAAQHGFDLFSTRRFAAVIDGIDAFCADTLHPTIRTSHPAPAAGWLVASA